MSHTNAAVDPAFWKGKRVLLTGHTGFKGSWMSIWLKEMGAELTGFALKPPTSPSLFDDACVVEGMNSIIGDVRNLDEVKKVSNREYCTGFFYGPIQNGQNYSNESYERCYDFVAVVEHSEGNIAFCHQRNSFAVGDEVEIIESFKLSQSFTITEMFDENGDKIQQAKHPNMKLSIKAPHTLKPFSVIRKMQSNI